MKQVSRRRVLLALAAGCLFSLPTVEAKKPDNPGGGNGGGGDTAPRFSFIELPVDGDPIALSEPSSANLVTVAISSTEEGYSSAAFAIVDAASGSVLDAGFLPEPPFVNPNDGVMENGPSGVGDVNALGEIVGYAAMFDPDSTNSDPNRQRAMLWTEGGSGYTYTLLPLLPGHTDNRASGTNTWGDIVGSQGPFPDSVAVLWAAEDHTAMDLNTPATVGLGWQLLEAVDINDDGLIVGLGFLDGVFRGFVLDPVTDTIWAVPLIGPATSNVAFRINAHGRLAGWAWNGDERVSGTNPDFVQGYSWSGPGTAATPLPSVTDNTCRAGDLNDYGATVGNSYIATDDQTVDITVPTLWEFDPQGAVITTELQTEIPSKSSYTLIRGHGVNNDGWISVYGRKRSKGGYQWRALILTPTSN